MRPHGSLSVFISTDVSLCDLMGPNGSLCVYMGLLLLYDL